MRPWLCAFSGVGALGGVQSLTFRMGARKTEIPVRMKTMIPVTLCSLVEKSMLSGVTGRSSVTSPLLLSVP